MRSWQVFVTHCLNNDIESYKTPTFARYLWGLQFVLDSRQLQFFVPYFAGDMLVQYATDQWLTWLVRGECLTMRYLRPQCPKNTITLILCQGRFRHCVLFVLFFLFFSLIWGIVTVVLKFLGHLWLRTKLGTWLKDNDFRYKPKRKHQMNFARKKCTRWNVNFWNVPRLNQITLANVFEVSVLFHLRGL